jgi:hypothetical protein
VDVIPLKQMSNNEDPISSPRLIKTYKLTSRTDDKEAWEACLTAFLRSLQFTLSSIANPDYRAGLVDLEQQDTERTVESLLASGLPLPKSPSLQMDENMQQNGNGRRREREERGWWSLRFQQVLRELQRKDAQTFS